jgi:Putative auto-transporter adhesin, head GIN domain
MKKIGIIIFIIALVIGLGLANVFSFGKTSARFFSFSFGRGVAGSGNIVNENREISNFKAIEVGGIFQVEITAQKDFSVEIQADDNLLPLIKTEVDGGVLKIESTEKFKSKSPIIVKISAPNIEEMEVSGASKVSLVDLNNESLNVNASGASKITIAGVTKILDVDVSGASKVDAENLKSEDTSIEASGASSVGVSVYGDLKTNASGASNIRYSGTPKNVENKTSGASSVKAK